MRNGEEVLQRDKESLSKIFGRKSLKADMKKNPYKHMSLKWKIGYYWQRLAVWFHKRLQKPFGLCKGGPSYPCFKKGKRQRQNTAYHEDESNWIFVCDKCLEEINEYWTGMWQDYYSSVR